MKRLKKLFSKKLSKKQKICCVLLIFSVIAALCYAGIQRASASVVIQTGKKQDSGLGWTYTFEDNMLIMEYTYHYVSQAVISYETTGTIWTKKEAGGYPDRVNKNKREYEIKAVKQDIMPTGTDVYKYDSVGNGESYSKITYPAEAIIDLIKSVYEIEELEPDYPYEVYLSEVYCLKRRNTASDAWVVDYSKKYKNIDAIRGAASWSQSTYDGFEQYYDVPITFKLAGADLNIKYVDIDTGKELKNGEAVRVAVGNTKPIACTADIAKDGKTYAYANKVQLVSGTGNPSGSWTSASDTYTFAPTKEGEYTLYIACKAKEASLDVVYVDMETCDILETEEMVATIPLGDSKSVPFETGNIIADDTIYVYDGKIQVGFDTDTPTDSWVSGASPYTFKPTEEGTYTLFIGYKKAAEVPLSLVYIDVDTGDVLKTEENVATAQVGGSVTVSCDVSNIEQDGKEYIYNGEMQLGFNTRTPTGTWGPGASDYTFAPTKEGSYTLFIGYEKKRGEEVPLSLVYVNAETGEVLKRNQNVVMVAIGESETVYCDLSDITKNNTIYMYNGKMQLGFDTTTPSGTWETGTEGYVFEPTEKGTYTLFIAYEVKECVFVWGDKDGDSHWYICKDCGKKSPKHPHVMVESEEVDEKGNHIYTCECPEHPECDYTESVHVCVFEWGDNDASYHWYVCKECGKQSEKHLHVMVKTGTEDADGNVLRTCECTEHPECEYTDTFHVHEYIKWAPDANEQDYYDADTGYAEQGYVYDPDVYHWQFCAYNSCTSTRGRAKHIAGEYQNEGEGYLIQRCTECMWILDKKPLTVSLSIHPNGGTFPDGSKEKVVLHTALEYGSVTDLGKLEPQYWVTFEEGYSFTGFYIVEAGNSECFYSPDAETQTCEATSKFFYPLSNGNYRSEVKKDYILYAQKAAAEYTVRYNANGGIGLMYDRYHKVGVEQALSPNGFQFVSNITYEIGEVSGVVETTIENTRVNAGFTGWGMDANGPAMYADKQIVVDLRKTAGVVNLYAIWDYGTIILPNATATDGGSKLSGWMTEDGTFISVLNDMGNYMSVPYTLKGGDEALTAVWIANKYTVSFDSDGGTPCDPITVIYRKPYSYNNGGLPTTRKTGYTFLRWMYKPTNETITNDSLVLYPIDHTLTAQWKVNDVTVYLDYNFDFEQTAQNASKNAEEFSKLTSIDHNMDQMVLEYDSYYGALPQPTMDGYTFAGWYFEMDSFGNGCGHQDCMLLESGSRVTNPNTHTLYARWVKEQYRIDLDYNYDYSVWED